MDLTIEEPSNDISTSLINYDKLFNIEERLKATKGNDLFNPI
jgi:hypothetical protein